MIFCDELSVEELRSRAAAQRRSMEVSKAALLLAEARVRFERFNVIESEANIAELEAAADAKEERGHHFAQMFKLMAHGTVSLRLSDEVTLTGEPPMAPARNPPSQGRK